MDTKDNNSEKRNRARGTTRLFYIIIGSISLIIGFIGIFLPILPTTPFLLLSAACFYRGSEKLHSWLLQSSLFGPTIRDYEEKGGLSKSTKIGAILITWLGVVISIFFLDSFVHIIGLVVLALIGSMVILRLKTVT